MNYFCGCPHFNREGHAILRRPFSTALEMSQCLLDGIKRRVSKTDKIYFLGDFAFTLKEMAWWHQQIPGQSILILGNHDPTNIDEVKKIWGKYSVRTTMMTKCCDINIFLSHYPHFYWDKSHYGSFHVYSHMHDMREQTMDSIFPERRSMDCGFDTAKRILGEYIPFSEIEIFNILGRRKGHDDVNFYIKNHGEYIKNEITTLD